MVARYKKLINKPYIKNDMIGGAGKALAKSKLTFKEKTGKIIRGTIKAPVAGILASSKGFTTGLGLGLTRPITYTYAKTRKYLAGKKLNNAQRKFNTALGLGNSTEKDTAKKVDKLKKLQAAEQLLISSGKNTTKFKKIQSQIAAELQKNNKLKALTTLSPENKKLLSKFHKNPTGLNANETRDIATLKTKLGITNLNTLKGFEGLDALRKSKLEEIQTKKTTPEDKQKQKEVDFYRTRLARKLQRYENRKSNVRSKGITDIGKQTAKSFSNTWRKYQNISVKKSIYIAGVGVTIGFVMPPLLAAYPAKDFLKTTLGDFKNLRNFGLQLKNTFGLRSAGDQAVQLDKYNKQTGEIEDAIKIVNGKLGASIASLKNSLNPTEFESIKTNLDTSNQAIKKINDLSNQNNNLQIQLMKATRDGEETSSILAAITQNENEIKQNQQDFYNNREAIRQIGDLAQNTDAKSAIDKYAKYSNNLVDLNKAKIRIFGEMQDVTKKFLGEYTKQARYLEELGTDKNPESTGLLNKFNYSGFTEFKSLINSTKTNKFVLDPNKIPKAIDLLSQIKNNRIKQVTDGNDITPGTDEAIKYLTAIVILNSSYINKQTPTSTSIY
jgi:hypothetical protein